MIRPTVSVIIPTTTRPELEQAVLSAQRQSIERSHLEIVVVNDSRDVLRGSLPDHADLVLNTAGLGAANARNAGVEAASGDYVAFLDDDDEWHPSKLERQLARLSEMPPSTDAVASCRVVQKRRGERGAGVAVPAIVIREGQPVQDYLFRNRRPSRSRASLFTSTLLAPRSLALRVPWDSSLRRHQDWDWLVRLEAAGASVVQLDEALATIHVGSAGSISAKADWHSSLSWAEARRATWDRRTYADFVAGQPLRYALQARSPAGVRAAVAAIHRGGVVPSLGPSLIGIGGLLTRASIERLLTSTVPGRTGGKGDR